MSNEAQMLELIRELLEPDGCQYDHNGSCQTHDYYGLGPGEKCPHERARELLSKHPDPAEKVDSPRFQAGARVIVTSHNPQWQMEPGVVVRVNTERRNLIYAVFVPRDWEAVWFAESELETAP